MIDRDNLFAAEEFFRDRRRKIKALRAQVRRDRKAAGIESTIPELFYDIAAGICPHAQRAVEVAPIYGSSSRGASPFALVRR